MNIAGMGIVCSRGRGVSALETCLEQGWVQPTSVDVRGSHAGPLPVYAVSAETLNDKVVLSKARRADRFTRMSVLAASDALQDSGLGSDLDRARLGVIVGTAFGPHVTTFSFLDGILDFGDGAVSPTAFSHSVHNAAASYIAMTLDVRGPTLTLTHFHFAFHQAVLLARIWLDQGRCDAVLVGVADELGTVMEYACGRMLTPARDGRINPFAFSSSPEVVPGEGSVFFLLTKNAAGAGYGRVAGVVQSPVSGLDPVTLVHVLDACGMARDESAYRAVVVPGRLTAGYAPLFGSILTGSAFHAATGALMLKKQKHYACPVQENPHGVRICRETTAAAVSDVLCTRLDCAGRQANLHLTR